MGNEASTSSLRMELLVDEPSKFNRKSSKSFHIKDKDRSTYKSGEHRFSLHAQKNPAVFLDRRRSSSYLKAKSLREARKASLETNRSINIKKQATNHTLSAPGSLSPDRFSGGSKSADGSNRKRSLSLCSRNGRSNSFYLASTSKANGQCMTRRGSYLSMLQRMRIQQCFKAAKTNIGKSIIKRACLLRGEFRSFYLRLPDRAADSLEADIYQFVAKSVENINDIEQVNMLAITFGEGFVPLYPMGFRPEYFALIADAATAECVKLDGGTHKQCETTLAWIQHFSFLFSNVRDGYYARMRALRRDSLTQYRSLNKQAFSNNLNQRPREVY